MTNLEEIRVQRQRLVKWRKAIDDDLARYILAERALQKSCPHDNMVYEDCGCDEPIFRCHDCGWMS